MHGLFEDQNQTLPSWVLYEGTFLCRKCSRSHSHFSFHLFLSVASPDCTIRFSLPSSSLPSLHWPCFVLSVGDPSLPHAQRLYLLEVPDQRG